MRVVKAQELLTLPVGSVVARLDPCVQPGEPADTWYSCGMELFSTCQSGIWESTFTGNQQDKPCVVLNAFAGRVAVEATGNERRYGEVQRFELETEQGRERQFMLFEAHDIQRLAENLIRALPPVNRARLSEGLSEELTRYAIQAERSQSELLRSRAESPATDLTGNTQTVAEANAQPSGGDQPSGTDPVPGT